MVYFLNSSTSIDLAFADPARQLPAGQQLAAHFPADPWQNEHLQPKTDPNIPESLRPVHNYNQNRATFVPRCLLDQQGYARHNQFGYLFQVSKYGQVFLEGFQFKSLFGYLCK